MNRDSTEVPAVCTAAELQSEPALANVKTLVIGAIAIGEFAAS
ncbi:MAG TPA: hypothetical protein VMY99_02230 [Nevskiaceae bacterium]|nr:hypothetical protein [Nevskiaceae bacterium]